LVAEKKTVVGTRRDVDRATASVKVAVAAATVAAANATAATAPEDGKITAMRSGGGTGGGPESEDGLVKSLKSADDTLVVVYGSPEVLHRVMRHVNATLGDVHIAYGGFVRQVAKKAHRAMGETENYGRDFAAGTMGAGVGRWLLCLPYFRGFADSVRDLRPEMRAGVTAAFFTPPLPPTFFNDGAAAPFYRQYGAHTGSLRRFVELCRREVTADRGLEWIGDARSEPFMRGFPMTAITGDAVGSHASSPSLSSGYVDLEKLEAVFDAGAASRDAEDFIVDTLRRYKSRARGGGGGGGGGGTGPTGDRVSGTTEGRPSAIGGDDDDEEEEEEEAAFGSEGDDGGGGGGGGGDER
jgi:hypothetical protein